MNDWVELRRGAYHDSVTLMRVSREVTGRPGVIGALTAMATELNCDLLAQMGFVVPAGAGPNDLVIALRAAGDPELAAARSAVDELLTSAHAPPPASDTSPHASPAISPARTTGSAARRTDAAALALISVPGPHAFTEAMDALSAGLNVMIFSDNVPVDQEVALKDEAARRGRLVMGPDCGTAVIGGVGLGFANAVRPGRIGLVAASGTGAQQVMCLLDEAGAGISHTLGVGGRDLSAQVSGRSALAALAALDADPATELIVVIAKPPAPAVVKLIHAAVARLSTPALLSLLGSTQDDLTTVAAKAASALGLPVPGWPHWPAPAPQRPRRGALRGLFAGGTLRDEAMLIAESALGPIHSDLPLPAHPAPAMSGTRVGPVSGTRVGTERPAGHMMIDFGDDRLTHGRAHPMIDPTLRLERLAAEAADPECAVILLDVVLGYGAEPDPAAALAPAIEQAAADRDLAVVVSLCGTAADPQDRDRQAHALSRAGAAVFASNADATRHAVSLIRSSR